MSTNLAKTLAAALAGDQGAAADIRSNAEASANPAERAQWAAADAQLKTAHPEFYGSGMNATAAGVTGLQGKSNVQDPSFLQTAGKDLGGLLKVAAPFASLIPGVGIPLGMALGAGGHFLGSELSGQGADLGGSLLAGGEAGLGGVAKGALSGSGSGGLGSLTGKGGLGNILQLGTAALGSLQGAKSLDQQQALQQQQIAQANAEQGNRNLLQNQAVRGLAAPPPTAPNLGSLYAGSQNPFAQKPLGPLQQAA